MGWRAFTLRRDSATSSFVGLLQIRHLDEGCRWIDFVLNSFLLLKDKFLVRP